MLALASVSPLWGQSIRGVVRDSATGSGLPGALVLALDSAGETLARSITGETGAFSIALPRRAPTLRFVRLGYSPRQMRLDPNLSSEVQLALSPIPALLQTVSIEAARGCPARADARQALALFEQVRAGLLATIVARESSPARMVLYGFERRMEGTSDRVVSQRVSVDSARGSVTYRARLSAAEFARAGFVTESQQGLNYLAPDPEVLLSPDFAGGYCFAIAQPTGARLNQVGLVFEVARRVRDRVDIQGTLWVDTVHKALTDLEFRYRGLDRELEALSPGGAIQFREMPNGVALLNSWRLRLAGADYDSLPSRRGTSAQRHLIVSESGGELARAIWPDGKSWHAPLGKLRVMAVDSREVPAANVELWLPDSPYRARTGSDGWAEFTDLVPGPYRVSVVDTQLARIGLSLPVGFEFNAGRDSTLITRVVVPTASDYVLDRCKKAHAVAPQDTTGLLVRVMAPYDVPVPDVRWKVLRRSNDTWSVVRDGGRTGTDGMFQMCDGGLDAGAHIAIFAQREGWNSTGLELTLGGPVTILKLVMTERP